MADRAAILAAIEAELPPRRSHGVDISRLGESFMRYMSDDQLACVLVELVSMKVEAVPFDCACGCTEEDHTADYCRHKCTPNRRPRTPHPWDD